MSPSIRPDGNGSLRDVLLGFAQLLILVVGVLIALTAGYLGFIVVPRETGLSALNVFLVLLLGLAGVVVSSRLADSLVSRYNVAEVGVHGPILRDVPGVFPRGPRVARADEVVEQIRRADEDPASEALLVKLNTPGGQVVPSDDIRRAVEDFDGPTVAYATDVCASGGYWIASACDRIVARDAGVVGSIGVIGSVVNARELADRLGLSYERFAAGRYKDAGNALKEMTEDEREYLQGLIDGYYDAFVERVTESRDLSEEEVRGTEARVYLGEEAVDVGLVDEVGTREDVEEYLGEEIGREARVQEFEPERGLGKRFRRGVHGVAYMFGAGLAGVFGDEVTGFDFRVER